MMILILYRNTETTVTIFFLIKKDCMYCIAATFTVNTIWLFSFSITIILFVHSIYSILLCIHFLTSTESKRKMMQWNSRSDLMKKSRRRLMMKKRHADQNNSKDESHSHNGGSSHNGNDFDGDMSLSTLGAFGPEDDTASSVQPVQSQPLSFRQQYANSMPSLSNSNLQRSFRTAKSCVTHSSAISLEFSERVKAELSPQQIPRGKVISRKSVLHESSSSLLMNTAAGVSFGGVSVGGHGSSSDNVLGTAMTSAGSTVCSGGSHSQWSGGNNNNNIINNNTTRLHPLPGLVGRTSQEQVLQESLYWILERQCRGIVNITGESGSGKTCLAAHLRDTVTSLGGYFATGKFDGANSIPCSGWSQVLTNLVHMLVQEPRDNNNNYDDGDEKRSQRQLILERVREAVRDTRQALQFLIPNLDLIFQPNRIPSHARAQAEDESAEGPPTEATSSSSSSFLAAVDGRQAVLLYAVREFVRAVASTEYPLVFVLNDMQNTDLLSLGLLDELLADQQGGCLLLITTTREDETSSPPPHSSNNNSVVLQAWHDKLAQVVRANVMLQQLHLDPLSLDAVTEMIRLSLGIVDNNNSNSNASSSSFNMSHNHNSISNQHHDDSFSLLPPEEERPVPVSTVSTSLPLEPLATLIKQKTRGNAYFILQFLQSLLDQQLLRQKRNGIWYWDVHQIQQTQQATRNVADLMTQKLNQVLDAAGKACLAVGAQLGQSFTFEILTVAYCCSHPELDDQNRANLLRQTLQKAVQAGLLEHDTREDCYYFVHDQVQDAAARCGSDSIDRIDIGHRLLEHYDCNRNNQYTSDECLFVGIDLCLDDILDRTPEAMTNSEMKRKQEAQHEHLAPFLQQAGDLAMCMAAFPQALEYYETGLQCLDHQSWEDNHKLFLALTSGAAEAAHCSANHTSLEKHLASILGRDMSLAEKMRAYMMRIKSYGEKEKFQQAIATAVDVYNQMGLGTTLTTSPGKANVVMELLKTKKFLKKHTQESLIALPLMEDERRIAAMGIIDMLAVPAYSASPMLYVLIWIRAVRWSVKFGVCKYSATAFSRFSVVMGAVLKKTQEAFMYAQVALGLSDRLHARDTLPKTVAGVYGFTLHWSNEWRSCLNPLMYGYQVGMQTGDIEYAFHSLLHYNVAVWLTASHELDQSVADLEEHCRLMQRYNQKALHTVTSMLLYMGKHFQCDTDDPLTFSFRTEDEAEMPDSAIFVLANRTMKVALMHVCYYFGDYKEALRHAKDSADIGVKVAQGYLFVARHRFMHGLIAVANSRGGFDRKIAFAKTVVKTLDGWVEDGKVDCKHYSELLQAEICSAQGQVVKAIGLYNAALETAEQLNFLHDSALIHERAGIFYNNVKNTERACFHLGQAVVYYRRWGAMAKVKHLIKTHGSMIPTSLLDPQDD